MLQLQVSELTNGVINTAFLMLYKVRYASVCVCARVYIYIHKYMYVCMLILCDHIMYACCRCMIIIYVTRPAKINQVRYS